jgi:hypothetical protein
MTRLREGLVASEWITLDTVQAKYAGMRLWSLYVGAYVEQTISCCSWHGLARRYIQELVQREVC